MESERGKLSDRTKDFVRSLGPDLCNSKKLSLSKGLLANVTPNYTGLEIYAKYFAPFCIVDEDSNISALGRTKNSEAQVRNSMYNLLEPEKDPAFFNFGSHHDVNRLAKMLDLEIVIYRYVKSSLCLEIFHDFRAFQTAERKRKPVFFVVTCSGQLHKVNDSLDVYFEDQNYFFSKPDSRTNLPAFTCRELYDANCSCCDNVSSVRLVLKATSFLLDLPDPTPSSKILSELANDATTLLEHSMNVVESAKENCCISRLGAELFDIWNEKILIVGFCRSLASLTVRRPAARKLPAKCYFSTLLVVGPVSASMKELNLSEFTKVVCIYAEQNICLLDKPYVSEIISSFLKTSDRDKPIGGNYLRLPPPLPQGEAAEERRRQREEKNKNKKANQKIKLCKCSLCNLKTFDDNMSRAGPERLCVAPLCPRELLQLLGIDTPENLAALDRMCELSVASMDIESMTLSVDLEPPNSSSRFPYAEIDSAQLGGHFKKIQKPIMISHVDALTFHLPASERLTLTAVSDDESSFYEMLKIYWNRVVELQNACRLEKKKLSEPIRQVISQYKKVYFEEANKWYSGLSPFDPESGIFDTHRGEAIGKIEASHSLPALARGWWQLLPGQLEAQLNNLQRDYHVFSFYG